ncbi:MAG TPA: 23S rRNA (uracil(1939)-C(5))-methyltransferase RlmD [Steroidobacteraceae bacterium]|nr:23S rRNA (uracil(1939)-C(5))-methyltransferase RlmD [Steroidobacteraceae bacterium]
MGAAAALAAASDQVTPYCAHFDFCGGCALQHLNGAAQLRLKEARLRDTLDRLAQVAPARWLPAIASPPWGYRRRARLGVRYVRRKQRALVGFRERRSNLIANLERCEVLAPPLDALIMPLSALVTQLSIRERLPQIEVAIGDDAVALVLRVLAAPSHEDLASLRKFEALHGVRFYLQPGGIDSAQALSEPAPRLFYALPEAQLEIDFLPTDFIQVNAAVNRALVTTAAQLLELRSDSSVLDLYCGLGNFSLALARRAHSVVGVEGDGGLVARARGNARRNGIANADFFSADLTADVSAAPWLARRFSHVLLDPPRAGALALLPHIARLAPERVLYVACDPDTLARDVGLLVQQHGFDLLAAGVVDMFPHTAHVESLALLAPGSAHGG